MIKIIDYLSIITLCQILIEMIILFLRFKKIREVSFEIKEFSVLTMELLVEIHDICYVFKFN